MQRGRLAQRELAAARGAALRVQAHQRGHQVRRELAEKADLKERGNQFRKEAAELEAEKVRRGTTRAPPSLVNPSSAFGASSTKFQPPKGGR